MCRPGHSEEIAMGQICLEMAHLDYYTDPATKYQQLYNTIYQYAFYYLFMINFHSYVAWMPWTRIIVDWI